MRATTRPTCWPHSSGASHRATSTAPYVTAWRSRASTDYPGSRSAQPPTCTARRLPCPGPWITPLHRPSWPAGEASPSWSGDAIEAYADAQRSLALADELHVEPNALHLLYVATVCHAQRTPRRGPRPRPPRRRHRKRRRRRPRRTARVRGPLRRGAFLRQPGCSRRTPAPEPRQPPDDSAPTSHSPAHS